MPTTDRLLRVLPAALVLLACSAGPLLAAGQVQLQIVVGKQASITASQDWARALATGGVQNVRIRQAQPSDKVGIERSGTDESPLYIVTATLDAHDDLVLPGGRYSTGDVKRLAAWLDDLAAKGLPEDRPKVSAFGLEAEQFEQVRTDLSRPVTFSTAGKTRAEVLKNIGRGLQNSIQLDRQATVAAEGDNVTEELAGISSGTAIACVLRPLGYAMVPVAANGRVVYSVVRARPEMEIWPVGWAPEKQRREVLPALYEFLTVNLQNVTAAAALEEIAKRMKVPYLMDHNALARHGIDPAKTSVSLPQMRTFYGKALDRVLFQAGLKAELRVDESGRPLLWVTSLKPM